MSQSLEHWALCKQDNVEAMAFLSLGYYQDPRNVINQLNRELETSFTAAADEKMRDSMSALTTRSRLKTHFRFDPYSQVALLEIQEPQLKNIRVDFLWH